MITEKHNFMEEKNNFTNFGFKTVKIEEKSNLVKSVFSSVASKYDIMNDAMSGGIHRIWKDKMVKEITFNSRDKKYQILDVAGGTGDIAFRTLRKAQKENINTKITVSDINSEMLNHWQRKSDRQKLIQ